MSGKEPIGDGKVALAGHRRSLVADRFRDLAEHRVEWTGADGAARAMRRDVYELGRVAGVLPYDPVRGLIVLIRQVRAGAILASGHGELVEIAAGLIEDGEALEETARRECLEETGVPITDLFHLFDVMPSPGFTTEHARIFVGRASIEGLPGRAGEGGEEEETHPFACRPEEALEALDAGRIANGYTVMTLLGFARHRARIDALWKKAG